MSVKRLRFQLKRDAGKGSTFIEDKVTVYPPHAICKAEVPLILSALPEKWTAGIRTVRLCSAQKANPSIIAFFHPPDGSLMVKSRGFSKERVLRGLLTELAGHPLGLTFRSYRRLQKRDESRVQRLVAPLVEEITPQLSQKMWLNKKNAEENHCTQRRLAHSLPLARVTSSAWRV